MQWKPKDWVEHFKYGVGQIRQDRDDRFDVDFLNGGTKVILKTADLKPAQPPTPNFQFPTQKKKAHHSQFKVKAPAHETPPDFDHLVSCFMSKFSRGFEGDDFDIAEREYKEKAASKLKESLGRDVFQALLQGQRYAEVCFRAKEVLQSTNLVFRIEKAQFKNAALDSGGKNEHFAIQLFDLLHGTSSMEQRFANFCDLLSEINVNKWTVATYYQFLATDGQWMFMKPKVMKPMAESLKVALNYKAQPNWLTYIKLQELADRVESELQKRGLHPRSRIDVQGFIWAAIRIEAGIY